MPTARPQGRLQGAARAASGLSVDDAIAEITERQRTLYGEMPTAAPRVRHRSPARRRTPLAAPDRRWSSHRRATAPSRRAVPEAVSPPIMPSAPAAPALDISKLEEQLRNITTRIETLRPSSDLEEQLRNITARIETLRPNNNIEEIITGFRKELAEIGRQITEALPRHAVESLQIEVQALAQRIDHSRTAGSVDASALAGLERGLAEVRDALRNLTPAENLVGFDDAVRSLAQKIDLIIGKEDPAALQQLETAISALRGIVSHVASNDTLTKVAEDVRALAAKVDDFAKSAASGQAVSALESRLDTLADALNASTEAGHAVPRELEKLLSGLIEKLEWVQLTHTDHAALGHLEDRIAQLIKRLDASDARLGNLEAVERGLADLLVHINDVRSQGGAAALASPPLPAVDAIKRDVAEIKRSDRRTQDSLEAVHGTVEHVVDRLALIESGMHETPTPPIAASEPVQTDTATAGVAKTDFAKAAPAKTEPVKSEAAKIEPAKAEMLISRPAPASPAPVPAASMSAPATAPASSRTGGDHARADEHFGRGPTVGGGREFLRCRAAPHGRRGAAHADRPEPAAGSSAGTGFRARLAGRDPAVGRRSHRRIGSRRGPGRAAGRSRSERQAEFHCRRAKGGAGRRSRAARPQSQSKTRSVASERLGDAYAQAPGGRRRCRGRRAVRSRRPAHVPGQWLGDFAAAAAGAFHRRA